MQGIGRNAFCLEPVLAVSASIPLECSGVGELRGSQQPLGTARLRCPGGRERAGTSTAYVLGVDSDGQGEILMTLPVFLKHKVLFHIQPIWASMFLARLSDYTLLM